MLLAVVLRHSMDIVDKPFVVVVVDQHHRRRMPATVYCNRDSSAVAFVPEHSDNRQKHIAVPVPDKSNFVVE